MNDHIGNCPTCGECGDIRWGECVYCLAGMTKETDKITLLKKINKENEELTAENNKLRKALEKIDSIYTLPQSVHDIAKQALR